MPGANEIRHHISAVEQTKKITGAMEMVSSNRMRKVMGHIEQNNHYFDFVQKTMKELLTSSQEVSHPFLRSPTGERCTFIVISGDKGLCGSYNSTVLQLAERRIRETPNATIITMGNTAEDYFNAHGLPPDIAYFGIVQDPTLARVRSVTREIMHMFEDGLTDEIRVIYTSFYGDTKNQTVERRLLPILLGDYESITDVETINEIIYLPSAQTVFDLLVPQYVLGILFGVMVQAYASEHFARMNAMRSATTNAQDMLKGLRTRYNLARQSAITNEIAEISSAAEILKGDALYGGH